MAETQAERIRRGQRERLVQAAIAKQQSGKALTQAELRAFERWELEQDEKRGMRFLSALPKKHWVAWSGRQHKVLGDQAKLYGIPLEGKTVDVRAVAAWLHDFLAKYRLPLSDLVKLEGEASSEAKTLNGRKTKQQIEQLEKRNALLEMQLSEKRDELIHRELIHGHLVRGSQVLRAAGDRLYKKFGQEAGDVLARALEDFQRIVDELEPGEAAPSDDNSDDGNNSDNDETQKGEGASGAEKPAKGAKKSVGQVDT